LAVCAGPVFAAAVTGAASESERAALETEASTEAPLIDLTPDERSWLEAHPAITLAIDDNYHPRSYRGERGELAGINIDYVRLIG